MDLAFADCVLNLNSRQLLRGGVAMALEPKMYALLEVLIKRRPAVVTHVELDELLWPQVYVARTSLTRLVSELRAVLGDPPGESRIIRTVYKSGYAFTADVTPLGGPGLELASGLSLLWNERLHPLPAGETIAGRGAECRVVVEASTVSRRHARFTVSQGVATVEDLGSTNGTFVNAIAITAATRLEDGDEIALGKAKLKLRAVDPSARTEITGERPLRPARGR
jgi:DNA-binding winged helix-turn-helix (wHTH) protein